LPTGNSSQSGCPAPSGQVVDIITDTIYHNKTQEYRIYSYNTPEELEQILNQQTSDSSSYSPTIFFSGIVVLYALIAF
jgi:hypothetical protein